MSFHDLLSSDESLFLNPQFLDPDFIPPLVKYRENEETEIAHCIQPLLQGRNGKHVLISGVPGIGKTLVVKQVFKQMEEETSEVYFLYVNCWKKESPYKILLELCHQLQYKWVMNKNFDDLLRAVSELVNQKSAVIVLDEADKIQDYSILYTLLESLHRKSLILISNTKYLLSLIDDRIKSRLMPSLLDFRSYTYDEVHGILEERVKYVFVRGVLDSSCLDLIAEKAFEAKDLRKGLFLLKESGEIAESSSSRKILSSHTEKALSKLADFIHKEEDLNSEEKTILDIVKRNQGKTVKEIFGEYKVKTGKSYRTFQRKIKDLEKSNVINTQEDHTNSEGRNRIVYVSDIKTLDEF